MNKKLIRLTEGDLHRIVKESVNKAINEEEVYSGFNGGVHNYEKDYLDDLYEAMDRVRNLLEKDEESYKSLFGEGVYYLFNKGFYEALDKVVDALYRKSGIYH